MSILVEVMGTPSSLFMLILLCILGNKNLSRGGIGTSNVGMLKDNYLIDSFTGELG